MSIIQFNFSWMSFNIFLAVIPIILGLAFLKTKNKTLRYLLAIGWLLFLPNSIYLFTDLINLMRQWGRVSSPERLVLIFQYSILQIFGFVTFLLALYPFEKFTQISGVKEIKKYSILIIIAMNFVIGFGVTLGRVTRVNSWDVLFAPMNVVNAVFRVLTSFELLGLTILFGAFGNLLYFAFRKPVVRYFSTYLSRFVASQ